MISKDAELVKILQEHAVGMKKRFDGGRAIRSWDPLFTQLFDERDQIKMRWEMLEDGIKVTLKGEEETIRELIEKIRSSWLRRWKGAGIIDGVEEIRRRQLRARRL